MTDKAKLEKIKKLADAMYYAAFNLTTDASLLRKAMDEYHQFIIHEYCKEEPVSEDLKKAAKVYEQTRNDLDVVSDNQMVERAFKAGAQLKEKQIMKDAVDACVTDIRTYKEENEVDFTVMYEKGIIPYEIEQEVKLIIIKED